MANTAPVTTYVPSKKKPVKKSKGKKRVKIKTLVNEY